MVNLQIVKDEKTVEAIKKAIGGSRAAMRNVFVDRPESKDEAGNVTVEAATSYELAKSAFDAAAAIAREAGIIAMECPLEITNDAGEITSRPYEGMLATVAVVGARDRDKATGKMESGIRAVVLFPLPSLSAYLDPLGIDPVDVAAEEAKPDGSPVKWLAKLAEKESAHVAFRKLRQADSTEEFEAAFKGMPRTVEQFIAEYAGAESVDTEVFDDLWSDAKALLNGKGMSGLVGLFPPKAEFIKCLRSKAYALDSTKKNEELEKAGAFVYVGKVVIALAAANKNEAGESDPLDASAVEEWLAKRDEFQLPSATSTSSIQDALAGIDLSGI